MKGRAILRQDAKWETKQHDVLRGGETVYLTGKLLRQEVNNSVASESSLN